MVIVDTDMKEFVVDVANFKSKAFSFDAEKCVFVAILRAALVKGYLTEDGAAAEKIERTKVHCRIRTARFECTDARSGKFVTVTKFTARAASRRCCSSAYDDALCFRILLGFLENGSPISEDKVVANHFSIAVHQDKPSIFRSIYEPVANSCATNVVVKDFVATVGQIFNSGVFLNSCHIVTAIICYDDFVMEVVSVHRLHFLALLLEFADEMSADMIVRWNENRHP